MDGGQGEVGQRGVGQGEVGQGEVGQGEVGQRGVGQEEVGQGAIARGNQSRTCDTYIRLIEFGISVSFDLKRRILNYCSQCIRQV